jgi:hypothetical protein
MKHITLALLLTLCSLTYGDEPVTPVKTNVRHLSLFKNGYGFFSCEGKLPKGQQTLSLDRVPQAALGTLWFGTSNSDARVTSTKIVKRSVLEKRHATNFEDLIRSNPGAHVEVWTDEAHTGTLMPVIDPEPKESDPNQTMHPGFSRHVDMGQPISNRTTFFTLRTDDSRHKSLRFSDVRKLTWSGAFKSQLENKQEKLLLECALDKPSAGGALQLNYLQSGVSWIPAYEVDLLDNDTAVVRLKATVVNEVEDLENTEIQCIVGYPNFMYKNVEEPLSGRQTLQQFLETLTNFQDPSRNRRNAMMVQQAFSNNIAVFNNDWDAAVPVMPSGGEFKEDLFYYPPITLSMKKGERQSFVVSESTVPYQHVYNWNLADTIPLDNNGYYQGNQRRQPTDEEAIWHALKLENKGKQPWTTGSALIVRDGVPIGQDLLYYTSISGHTSVRITRATDVAGNNEEFEVERQQNAQDFYGNRHDLVTIRGEIKIQNKRHTAIHSVITKTTTGVVKETSPEAKTAVRAEGLRPVNRKSTLKWELDLEAGEEKTLTYTLEVFVRS